MICTQHRRVVVVPTSGPKNRGFDSHLDPCFEDEVVPPNCPEQLTPLPPGEMSAEWQAGGYRHGRTPYDDLQKRWEPRSHESRDKGSASIHCFYHGACIAIKRGPVYCVYSPKQPLGFLWGYSILDLFKIWPFRMAFVMPS